MGHITFPCVYCFSYVADSKEGTRSSTFWVLLSILLGAVAMLCKEQGITVLVRAKVQQGWFRVHI